MHMVSLDSLRLQAFDAGGDTHDFQQFLSMFIPDAAQDRIIRHTLDDSQVSAAPFIQLTHSCACYDQSNLHGTQS